MQIRAMLSWAALCGALLGIGTTAKSAENQDTTVITYEGETRGANFEKAQAVAENYCRENFDRAAVLRSLGQRDGKNFALFRCEAPR